MVCGRSKNVGMPVAMLLHSDGIGETDACKYCAVRPKIYEKYSGLKHISFANVCHK